MIRYYNHRPHMIIYCLKKVNTWSFLFFLTILFFAFTRSVLAAHNNSAHCGNGVCQASQNEDINSCPVDCGVQPTPTPTATPTPTPTSAPATPTLQPTPTTSSSPTSTPTPGSSTPTPTTATSTNNTTQTIQSPTPTPTPQISYPVVSLTPLTPDPTSNTTPTLIGLASTQQGIISGVEYSLDRGRSWKSALPQDGNFDSQAENFSITISPLNEGNYTILARSKSSQGVNTKPAQYATDNFTIITTPPELNVGPIPQTPTDNVTPTITATARSQASKVERVEISIDGGKSWRQMQGNGDSYTLQLSKLEDGNYNIVIRAIDVIGNTKTSETHILVIDTMPPLIGGAMYTYGPQVLAPVDNSLINLVSGTISNLVVSMRGGVTKAQIITDEHIWDLHKIEGTNTWYGKIQFDSSGEKSIIISAIDGANNKTQRQIGRVLVKKSGRIINSKSHEPIMDAKVTLYYFQHLSKTWRAWDGESFGQNNPIALSESGEYSFMVPQGSYYLEIKAPDFRTAQSSIIKARENEILNFDFLLEPKASSIINLPVIGQIIDILPDIIPDTLNIDESANTGKSRSGSINDSLIGSVVPDQVFYDLSGKEVKISDYKGKRMLVSYYSSWSMQSLEQFEILSQLSQSVLRDQDVIAVALQDSISSTQTLMRIGNYKFRTFVDPDGTTASVYNISILPQHFFIDSNGVIRETHVGALSKDEALITLTNLK